MTMTYREVLKQPSPEDVRRDLREDTPLLLVFLTRRVVVLLAGTLATSDTRVTRVTCNNKRDNRTLELSDRLYKKFYVV